MELIKEIKSNKEIELKKHNIEIIKYLGSGAFSDTYLAIYNNNLAAIKIPHPKYNKARKLHELEYEIRLLNKFKHSDHIINLLGYNIEPDKSFLAFEPLDNTLYNFIKNFKKNGDKIPFNVIILILENILLGLIELKQNKILHADLKPENILLSENKVKIIDLGNSIEEEAFSNYDQSVQTRHYRPPEFILEAKYDFSADMWAFGCIVYELLTGEVLFSPTKDNMSTNCHHIGMFIKTFGDIPAELLNSGEKTENYFVRDDKISGWKYKYSYIMGKQISIYNLLYKIWNIPKKEAKIWSDFLNPIFEYNIIKRITPEEALRRLYKIWSNY